MTTSKFGRKFTAAIASLGLFIGLSACGATHESTSEDRTMMAAILQADYGFEEAYFVEDVNKLFADDYTVYQVVFWGCRIEVKYDTYGDLTYLDAKKYEKAMERKSKEEAELGIGKEVDIDASKFIVHSEYFKDSLLAYGAVQCI